MTNVATRFQPDISGSAVPTGFVGEKITFTSRTVTCTNSGTWYANATALATLTTGVWLIYADTVLPLPSATIDATFAGVSTSNGNDSNNLICYSSTVIASGTTIAQGTQNAPIQVGYYIATTSTPIYAKAFNEDRASLTVSISGFAVRIA